MNKKILYVVNNDSTTSIPLELAGVFKKSNLEFTAVIYYRESKYPPNNFIQKPLNIGAKSLFDLRGVIQSAKLIRKIKPDVIHAHHSWSAFIFFLMAKFFRPSSKLIKTEHSKHDFARKKIGRWYQIVLNFFILAMADLIVCNSKSTLESFSSLEKKITKGQTVVCHNGVNIEAIEHSHLSDDKRNELISYTNDSIMIGSVGRLVKEKDYVSLIEAFALVKAKSQFKVKLVLIGSGPEEDRLKDKADQFGIKEDIIFPGTVERELVYGLLNELDIFIMTSKFEGFCNTLVEAMAARRAVVCSDIDTLREVAGDAALFGSTSKPEIYADRILELIRDEELKTEMQRKAAERAKMFSLDMCAKRYMSYYENN